jgi:SNF2 family DNA or RNA helicase
MAATMDISDENISDYDLSSSEEGEVDSGEGEGSGGAVSNGESTSGFFSWDGNLRGYQVPVVEGILSNWEEGMPAICTSVGGSGKTAMGSKAASLWGATHVVVVCPKAVRTKWRRALSTFFPEEDKILIYTYTGWRSCHNKNSDAKTKQPYTWKEERKKEAVDKLDKYRTKKKKKQKKEYDFEASDKWKDLVWSERVVMILDEYHKVQKTSQQTFACAANTRAILNYECNSRVLVLSYTPCDRQEDIINQMYVLGLVQSNKIIEYNRREKRYNVEGLFECIALTEKYAKVTLDKERMLARKLQNQQGRTAHIMARNTVGAMFLKYIKDALVFSCVPDFAKDPELKPVYMNSFCLVSDKTSDAITSIIDDGGKEPAFREVIEHAIDPGSDPAMAKLNIIQQEIEFVKRPIYKDLASEFLAEDPNNKVAIMVLYLDTLDYLERELEAYGVVRLEGKMSEGERDVSIRAFNANNTDFRVMCASLHAGGEGIDLHSTNKEYGRLILIPPTYTTKQLSQACLRVFRDGVKRRPTIKVVYTVAKGKKESIEKRFYDSVRRKTSTIKAYHAKGQNETMPCDYEDVITKKSYLSSVDLK